MWLVDGQPLYEVNGRLLESKPPRRLVFPAQALRIASEEKTKVRPLTRVA